jgi:hypothetical protein
MAKQVRKGKHSGTFRVNSISELIKFSPTVIESGDNSSLSSGKYV